MSVNNSTKARSKEMEDSSVRFLYYTQIDTISLKGRILKKLCNGTYLRNKNRLMSLENKHGYQRGNGKEG